MTTIFENILRMSAVAAVAIIIILALRLLLKKAPKVISYALWAIVLIRLLCPFSLESSLSIVPAKLSEPGFVEELSEAPAFPVSKLYSDEEGFQNAVDAGAQVYSNDNGESYVSVGAPPAFISNDAALKISLMDVFARVWLCGALIMLAWGIISFLRLKLRLKKVRWAGGNVYTAEEIDTPFVLGFISPKIYMPSTLEEKEWGYILRHERCHIRRGDHYIRALAFIALCIHWFNPLVWLAFILSGRDMEMSCDEAVIRSMGIELRADYAGSLLSLATGHRHISATPLAFGESSPGGRIKNLANWKKPALWIVIAAIIICVVAALCLLTDPAEKRRGEEAYCVDAMTELMERENLHFNYSIYNDGILRSDFPQVEAWFDGEDWLFVSKSDTPSNKYILNILQKGNAQYVLSNNNGSRDLLGPFTDGEYDTYGRKLLESFIDHEVEFANKAESENGTEYSFNVLLDGVKTENYQRYYFDKNGNLTEVRFEAENAEVEINGEAVNVDQTVVISFSDVGADKCREAIDLAFESIMAEGKGSDNEISDNAPPEGLVNEVSYPMAIPFGKSAEVDLDGDGIKEEVCQTLNAEGYRIESFNINGIEYIDLVSNIAESVGLGQLSNAGPDCWYIADVLTTDQNLELMIFDGGPSSDPVTMIFDYVGGELIYLGKVPAYVNEITFTGDGYFNANARLEVFQTWYGMHKWSIFGENRSIKEEPLDFYYVDFCFKDYVIGEEYFPSSETSTLLRDVKVFAEMDTESELRLYMKGKDIRILGTDNKEWVLIESGDERCYIHIKYASIEVPGGDYVPATEILNGLHYFD